MWKKLTAIVLLGLAISAQNQANAMGRHKKKNPGPTEPSARQAFPRRVVDFKNFTTAPFRLPNGQQADIGQDVRLLVDTQINGSTKFSTNDSQPFTQRHGVLTGGVSSLIFNVSSVGLKFGYRNGTDLNSGSSGNWGITGAVKVDIGLISMDFKIYDSETGETYGAVSVDQNMAGVDLSFNVDFNGVTAGPDFLWKTPLKNVIQNLTSNAMKKLGGQSRVNFLPWESLVLGVDLSRNLVLFNEGVRGDIHVGDIFSVYRSCHNPGCFETFVADLKVMNVLEYSEAKLDGPRVSPVKIIEANDKVYIKFLGM